MILTLEEKLDELIKAGEYSKIEATKTKYGKPFEITWESHPNEVGDPIDFLKIGSWLTNFHILQETITGDQKQISLIDETIMAQIDLQVQDGFYWLNGDMVIPTVNDFIRDLARRNIRISEKIV